MKRIMLHCFYMLTICITAHEVTGIEMLYNRSKINTSCRQVATLNLNMQPLVYF